MDGCLTQDDLTQIVAAMRPLIVEGVREEIREQRERIARAKQRAAAVCGGSDSCRLEDDDDEQPAKYSRRQQVSRLEDRVSKVEHYQRQTNREMLDVASGIAVRNVLDARRRQGARPPGRNEEGTQRVAGVARPVFESQGRRGQQPQAVRRLQAAA